MGTHPIFESDFDCLTDFSRINKMTKISFNGATYEVNTTDEILNMVPAGEVLSMPIQTGMEVEEGLALTTRPGLLGGKVHGSLARAGKVKGQTPKVDPEEKKKKKTGRAARRIQYNRRFVTSANPFGRKVGPNNQAARAEKAAAAGN